MRADCHVHTHFSYDADKSATMAGYAAQAAAAGVELITFTDHSDFGEPNFPGIDHTAYFEEYRAVCDNCGVELLCGIECGLATPGQEINVKEVATYPFDYVIASQHIFDGVDIYVEPSFFDIGKAASYKRALEQQFTELSRFPDWDAVGHIGYFTRYYPGEDRKLRYTDAPEAIDAILTLAAQNGRAIEVNTRGRERTGGPIPPVEILKRFIELGGERFTLGSDSHRYSMLYGGIEEAKECIAAAGGRYFCVYRAREPEFIKI